MITRRAFLVSSTLTGTAAGVASLVHSDGLARQAVESRLQFFSPLQAAVAVAKGEDYGQQLRRAVNALGGKRLIAQRGDRVVIKPTLAWNRMPGQGGNVHPDVLRAAIELALSGGASEVIVFDRTGLRSQTAYAVSGAAAVVRELRNRRVKLVGLTNDDFVPLAADLTAAQPMLADYRICRYLLEADKVISVATARVHPRRQLDLGMANLLGMIGGGAVSAEFHKKEEETLALLSAALRPDLTILDATRAVVRNGPIGRGSADIERWHQIVVSRDPLAVEAYGAQLFGIEPSRLERLAIAESLAVGSATLTARRVVNV